MKYRRFKNTEIPLAKSHFGYNLRTRFLQNGKMLMNNTNFRFTLILDKTNNKIFLKSQKAPPVFGSFFTIFGHFCMMRIFFFPKGQVLSHLTINEPLTPC